MVERGGAPTVKKKNLARNVERSEGLRSPLPARILRPGVGSCPVFPVETGDPPVAVGVRRSGLPPARALLQATCPVDRDWLPQGTRCCGCARNRRRGFA